MHSIRLEWKEQNVNLQMVETWCRANMPTYVGNSADSAFTLWFSEAPSSEDAQAVQDYWDGLDEESEEVAEYVSRDQIRDRIEELKAGIPGKTWNQLNAGERKLVLGLAVTKDELWPEGLPE